MKVGKQPKKNGEYKTQIRKSWRRVDSVSRGFRQERPCQIRKILTRLKVKLLDH